MAWILCGDLAHQHVEADGLYVVPAEWSIPMAIGTAPDTPPGAKPLPRAPASSLSNFAKR
jgi:hypothetical protein